MHIRIGGSVMKPYASPKEWLTLVRELGYGAVIFPVDSSAERYRNASAFIVKCFGLLGPHIRSIHAHARWHSASERTVHGYKQQQTGMLPAASPTNHCKPIIFADETDML